MLLYINGGNHMGRGKYDTCENCINYDERREICRLDKKDTEKDD